MINRKVTIQGEQFDLVLAMCRREVCNSVEKLFLTNRQERGDEIQRIVALDAIMGEIRDVATLHTFMSSVDNFQMVKEGLNPDLTISDDPFVNYQEKSRRVDSQ